MALTTAAAVAGTAAATAYLNAKYHVGKDVDFIIKMKRGERALRKAVQDKRANCYYLFEQSVKAYQDELCLWSRDGIFTWKEMYDKVNQYGNFFLSKGVKPGQFVAIYLLNCPEFLFIWFGLFSIGCAPALINNNLASESLVHCVKISGAKLIVVDGDVGCQQRVKGTEDKLSGQLGIEIVALSDNLKAQIVATPATRPADALREASSYAMPLALVYTSGTTGLPKAFGFSLDRSYVGGVVGKYSYNGVHGDRWYICMPLYHATGGVSCMSHLMAGNSIAIGRKFSLRNFWKDVRDSESTVFVYVGETARYLLSAPPSPDDKNHKVRLMFGNGMRPDVWPRFQERFGVPEVAEFFNSTEGMFNTIIYTRSGFGSYSVGHHGWIFRQLFRRTYVPVALDPDTGDIWRDPSTGFAKRAPYKEGGEIIVKLPEEKAWQGYHGSVEASQKKLARDVFKKGDVYYRTGDALRRTDDGLWYFMDRLGDTFRWKGENVSTAEVAEVLGTIPGLNEANVYGVALPNHDGRAGCAAITIDSSKPFDWNGMLNFSRAKLPKYAVPQFVRVTKVPMNTHNNKQNKVQLRQEGVDPSLLGTKVQGGGQDDIYWIPSGSNAYTPFQQKDWAALSTGSAKL